MKNKTQNKKSVSNIEKFMIGGIVALGALVAVTGSAHAAANVTASSTAQAVTVAPNVMGPVAPEASRASNVVEVPRIAGADCFNIYRDGALLAKCIKPSVDATTGDYYYDDKSVDVTPASRWTYEVSAVNATGESPRIGQGGPYPWH